MVVATGADSFSASSASSDSAPEITTPPPQMKTGFFDFLINLTAISMNEASGPVRLAGKLPSVGSAQTSARSTGPFCTSNGSAICAAPGRPVVIASNAARNVRGMSAERLSTAAR